VSWTERILGIVLGVILGVVVVVVFVFVYSEQTVDAPSISDHARTTGANGSGRAHRPGRRPATPPVATVRVLGGAPPPGGPAQLRYRKGDLVRLRIVSDQAVTLKLLGYGPQFAAGAGQPVLRRFKASKTGDFPLLAVPSHIDVARISIGPPGA
jgi:hypothetical protein